MNAADLLERLRRRGERIACAESLTGGLVCAALVDVPGASAVLRGGIVCYATDVKADLLGVDRDALARLGPVDRQVCAEMAQGVRRVLGADWGLAATGVAGPEPQGDVPVGTVFVAVAGAASVRVVRLRLTGTRSDIRRDSVQAVLDLAGEVIAAV